MIDILKELKKIKPMPRNVVKLMAAQYGLYFKWYHTTGFMRTKILEKISFGNYENRINITYKWYIFNEAKRWING